MRNESVVAEPPQQTIQELVTNVLPKLCRNDQMGGRDYIVVPMVILTEGVHHGSEGPFFYPKEELQKIPTVWNHKPVVVYHPEMNGQGVSACDPSIISSRSVGVMMNTRYEKGRLKSEAWIEKDRADAVDERIMAAVEAGEMMELSTGVFTDNEMEPGEWNGEAYIGIARNYRPDHLALLPDKIGACSISDGAGFLRNEEKKKKGAMAAAIQKVLARLGLVENELSFDNTRAMLATALRERFNANLENGPFLFVEDVYQNFVVYEFDNKLFRLGYTSTDTGVTLSEDQPVEVKRVTEYRTVDGSFVGNQEEGRLSNQSNQEDDMEKKQMVEAIITANIGWSKDDHEKLMSFSDDQLKVLHKATESDDSGEGGDPPATSEPTPAPAQKATSAPTANQGKGPQTIEEFIDSAPAGIQEVLRNGVDVLNEEKSSLISAILQNKEGGFTEDELKSRPIGELRKIARLAAPVQAKPSARPAYYGGQGPTTPVENQAEEPMEVPTLNFEKAAS